MVTVLDYEITGELPPLSQHIHIYKALSPSGETVLLLELHDYNELQLQQFLEQANQNSNSQLLPLKAINSVFEHQLSYFAVIECNHNIGAFENHVGGSVSNLETKLKLSSQLCAFVASFHNSGMNLGLFNLAGFYFDNSHNEFFTVNYLSNQQSIEALVGESALEDKEQYLLTLSPEATGRVNRKLDIRSDLYTLGVLMYRIFYGHYPFDADDAMELVHAHIAKDALFPFAPDIPLAIEQMLRRLLKKDPEARYQNIESLLLDVNACLRQAVQDTPVEQFTLVSSGRTAELVFPDILYGREQELRHLTQLCAGVQEKGNAQVVVVKGRSGVGKSAFIRELSRPAILHNGIFAQGKSEQYQRSASNSVLIAAIDNLLEQFLLLDEARLAEVRKGLEAELSNELPLLLTILPRLSLVLAKEISDGRAQDPGKDQKPEQALYRLLLCLGQVAQQIVLFLDDLHWIDSLSLNVLCYVFQHQELPSLMFVFSFRDNELTESHPLQHLLQTVNENGIPLDVLTLEPLAQDATQLFIEDTFWETSFDLYELCAVVQEKTGGNPFFVREFLKNLADKGLLFQLEDGVWGWRESEIHEQKITESVVDLVSQRLARLPLAELNCLKLAACLGNRIPYAHLKALSFEQNLDLDACVGQWLNDGLFVGHYDENNVIDAISFSHDRIQQAAYQLPLGKPNGYFHFQISDAFIRNHDDVWLRQNILDVISHIQQSISVHLENRDNRELAKYYYWAGRTADINHVFDAAKEYYQQGVSLLEKQHWRTDYQLCFGLNFGLCNVLYLTQDFEGLDGRLTALYGHANTSIDSKKVCKLRILLLVANNQMALAYKFGIDNIDVVELPAGEGAAGQYFEIESLYPAAGIEAIAELPELSDQDQALTQEILNALHTPSYIVGPDKYLSIMYNSLLSLLKHGLSSVSPKAIMGHAQLLAGAFGRYDEAMLLVAVAEKISERFPNLPAAEIELELIKHSSILHWRKPLRESIPALKHNYFSGYENGHVEYAFHSLLFSCFYNLFSGESLEKVSQDLESAIAIFTEKQQLYHLGYSQIWHQLTWNLHAKVTTPRRMLGPAFNEDVGLQPLIENNNVTTLLCFYISKVILCYHYGDTENALRYAQLAEPLLDVAPGLYHVTEFEYYRALLYMRQLHKKADHGEQPNMSLAQRQFQKIQGWLGHGSANHSHQALLLEAEFARLEKRADAWQLYSKAIAVANQQQFTQHSAIAHELYAGYWLEQGETDLALSQLQLAYKKYEQWKAFNLCEHLLQKHPELKRKLHGEVSATASGLDNRLDLASILKAAETLTGVVDLEAFIEKMMSIIVENAGAQRGCILFYQHDGISLETSYPTPISKGEIPNALINYVSRTLQPYIVEDSTRESKLNLGLKSFGKLPQSMLLIPIVVSGDLRGILYLEHKDLTGFFKADRVDVLQLLANQTAILFDNARLYKELLASNKDLERKVEVRTEELAKAKLKAEEATAAKSNFLANMSHEIRTPMNAVIGLSRLALRKQRHPEHKDYLEKILSSSEALLTLINDILDFSKIEAQKLTLEQTTFSLESSLRRVVNLNSHRMHEKHLEFVLSVDPDVPDKLMGDPLRLEQVIINLVSNAIKFTDKGYVQVAIKVIERANNKIRLGFAIQDSGIGMSKEQSERLFQSFSQADDSVTRRYGGTGLGLAICKQLCQLMGGEIWVDSEPGKGSNFQFTAALLEVPEDKETLSKSLHPGNMRALVVDDMAIARKVMCDYLVGFGIQTDTVTNGKEALDAVIRADMHQRAYDVVLMDWKMPEMDGITASKLIREQVSGKTPHILMVSAYDRAELEHSQSGNLVDDFLEKPVSASSLIDSINAILGNRTLPAGEAIVAGKVPDLKGYRLLLVEDNKINQQVAMEFLLDTNADVDVAGNGIEAIEALRNIEFDLVFMDIQMPVMDGLTATSKIREFNPDIPIVAMTAHAMEGDKDKSLQAGMNGHVTKPIDPEQVYRVLAQFLAVPAKSPRIGPLNALSAQKMTTSDNGNRVQQLRQLGTLDVDAAIERFQGKTQLYEELVRDFVKDYSVICTELKALAAAENNELLHRKIHSLKSNTAYIGAMELSRNVAVLEQMILDAVDFELELHVVIEDLEALLAKLSAVVPVSGDANSDEVGFEPDLVSLLQRLLPMLQGSDFNVERHLASLDKYVSNETDTANAQKLAELIDDMEFEDAYDLVNDWLTTLSE